MSLIHYWEPRLIPKNFGTCIIQKSGRPKIFEPFFPYILSFLPDQLTSRCPAKYHVILDGRNTMSYAVRFELKLEAHEKENILKA
ncbi:hypothetical protein, partial [Candidatus Igneacidithiobacillus taiwanensis]|uniref:hypothetical protein n=1 Tax=Candidatus Igneacidithiobacillus taiwanensis TaxID=1945924 RepID=UPI0028A1B85C